MKVNFRLPPPPPPWPLRPENFQVGHVYRSEWDLESGVGLIRYICAHDYDTDRTYLVSLDNGRVYAVNGDDGGWWKSGFREVEAEVCCGE